MFLSDGSSKIRAYVEPPEQHVYHVSAIVAVRQRWHALVPLLPTRHLELDLSLFPEGLRNMAASSLLAGDVLGFLCRASNELSVDIVSLNMQALRERGLFEEAIVEALTADRLNNRHQYRQIDRLIRYADRTRLLAAGDQPPELGPWKVYRGVGGMGRARRIRGYSWTTTQVTAQWFAARATREKLADPAVYTAIVPEEHVLFYWQRRKEAEFFLSLPKTFPVFRLS